MRCYRSVPLPYGDEQKILQGVGAARHPGRWNTEGMGCLYSSSSLEASVSERAYHSLMFHIDIYNKKVSSKGKNFPKAYFEEVQKVKFKLAVIEVLNSEKLMEITTDEALELQLKKAGLPIRTFLDARQDKYELLKPANWTRQLGRFLNEQRHSGMIVPSARTDKGNTVVLFEDNLQERDIKIIEIDDLELSAVSLKAKELKHGGLADPNKVAFRYKSQFGEAEFLIL